MLQVFIKNPAYTEEAGLLTREAYREYAERENIIKIMWLFGDPIHTLLDHRLRHLIVAVTASKSELFYILAHVTNIPTWDGAEMMTWRGETAQFIVDHLLPER